MVFGNYKRLVFLAQVEDAGMKAEGGGDRPASSVFLSSTG